MRIFTLSFILMGTVLFSGCAVEPLQTQLNNAMPEILAKIEKRKHFGGRLLIVQPSKHKMIAYLKAKNPQTRVDEISFLVFFIENLYYESFQKSAIYDEVILFNCEDVDVWDENICSQQKKWDKLESYARQNGFDYTVETVKDKIFFTDWKTGCQISLTNVAGMEPNSFLGEVEKAMEEFNAERIKSGQAVKDNKTAAGAVNNNYALCVGLVEYKNPEFSALIYAAEDAADLVAELKKLKWKDNNLKLLNDKNAVKAAIQDWLNKVPAASGENDLVIFWSGRAFKSEDIYLACYDSKMKSIKSAFRLAYLINAVKAKNCGRIIFILDLCSADGKTLDLKEYFNKLRMEKQIPKGWMFIVSSSPDREAEKKSDWKNGALSYCLLQGLRGKADGVQDLTPKDGKITLLEIYNYLSYVMPVETGEKIKQTKYASITANPDDPDIWRMEFKEGKK